MKKGGHALMNKALTAPPHRLLPFLFNKNHPTLSSYHFDYFYSQSSKGSGGGGEGVARDTERSVSEEKEMSGLEVSSTEQAMADGATDAKAEFVESDPWDDAGGNSTTKKGNKIGQQSDSATATQNPNRYGQ